MSLVYSIARAVSSLRVVITCLYDPRCEGSASIKKVLPVVCPELSYKDLGIQDGNSAQRLWMQAVLDETRAGQRILFRNPKILLSLLMI